ncbi:MAG: L-aspartate oxidase [Zetaproteobacteria bacterium]|nr:MAG: L-aspartate oxidase [Zetaproteobacteria bacterium]
MIQRKFDNRAAIQVDFLVIGSGAAGLYVASKLQPHGRVALVSKGPTSDANTWFAQGGIAGVLSSQDSIECHVQDTLAAGAGLCREHVVREVVARGSEIIRELIAIGTRFDTHEGKLHLTREGGHSQRRIAHAQDATGRAIAEALQLQLRPSLIRLTGYTAIDLITSHHIGNYAGPNQCLGAYFLAPDGQVVSVASRFTILATGGAGKVYLYTSNPHGASGDGIAMAWRAGCPVVNMEFIQFHPTCLFHRDGSNLLLSEALRGEGAHIVDAHGRRFTFDYDERGELAPRDIVARAIDHEMKKQGVDCMYLDARHLGEQRINRQFPNIRKRLLELGLDLVSSTIPIVPAAHYTCGGIDTDVAGHTAIEHLYAIGETAHSGLHGANRLASNSLLECLVMADFCAKSILAQTPPPIPHVPAWDDSGVEPEVERIAIKQNWDEIRSLMSHYVGIVRSNERLRRAKRRLLMIQNEIADHFWRHPVSRDLIELRNLALVAGLIIRSAQMRHESRGLHYSTDYPYSLEEPRDTVLIPDTSDELDCH